MSVYAVSDLHGMKDLWLQVKKRIVSTDILICLGDNCDRGPDGWFIIKDMLKMPNCIYLMGNHEDMLVKAVDESKVFDEGMYGYACLLHQSNGGKETFEDCLKDNEGFEVIEQLRSLPFYYHYISPSGVEYWLTHAGYTPYEDYETPCDISVKTLIWDRDHLGDTYFSHKDNFYIIHGHTPVEFCPEETFDGDFMGLQEHSPYLYGNNMKIDIDAGAFYTNETYLFNLDEFSFEVIKGDD